MVVPFLVVHLSASSSVGGKAAPLELPPQAEPCRGSQPKVGKRQYSLRCNVWVAFLLGHLLASSSVDVYSLFCVFIFFAIEKNIYICYNINTLRLIKAIFGYEGERDEFYFLCI